MGAWLWIGPALGLLGLVAAYGGWFLWGPLRGYRRIHIDHDGIRRSFLLPKHIPDGATQLVLVCHGAIDYARRLAWSTQWDDLARREGFVHAFPEATHARIPRVLQAWNAGHCCMHAAQNEVDDVGFLLAVRARIEELSGRRMKRLFVCGYSNGGMLAYHMARTSPAEVDAVGAVAGALWSGPKAMPEVTRPTEPLPQVPVVHVHGTEDDIVPYDGRPGKSAPYWAWSPVDQTVAAWVDAWGAVAEDAKPAAGPGDSRRMAYRTDDGVLRVVFYEHGCHHSWPGERRPFFLRQADRSWRAEEALWADWQQMVRPAP